MYQIKPVFTITGEVPKNSTMYSMKSIHSATSNETSDKVVHVTHRETDQTKSALFTSVKEKQKELLVSLAEIKEQLAFIKTFLSGKNVASPTAMGPGPSVNLNEMFPELVLNASVHHPPYSLLAFEKLWKVQVNATHHVHSSLKELPKNVKVFDSLSNPTGDGLRIRLVWKNMTSDCELVISPAKYISLQGEVNLLRFIQRHVNNSSDPFGDALLNEKLDLCHHLKLCLSNKEVLSVLSQIMSDESKSKWILGEKLTLVDVAAWSAIKSLRSPALSKTWSSWLKSIEQELGVKC